MGGKVPEAWTNSIMVPIWKANGDAINWANYRLSPLLCHTMKIFVRILGAHLQQIVTVTPKQCRFVKGFGIPDATHAVRLLEEKHQEKNQPVHMAFVDLEKAFNRVPYGLIWHALRSHGVPKAYVDWVKLLYMNVTSAVRCPEGVSRSGCTPGFCPFAPPVHPLHGHYDCRVTHGHSSTPTMSS